MAKYGLYPRDKVGRLPSKALFIQYNTSDDSVEPIYDMDVFREVYVKCEDVTGYKAAIELIGDWTEWERLKRDFPGFNDLLKTWNEEIETLLKARAMQKILGLLDSDSDSVALNAAKWVAEDGHKKRAGAGRPSNAEKKKAAKEMAQQASDTKEERRRIEEMLN